MSQHLLAAGNHLLGSTNFLILNLPEGWHFSTGLHPAEVDNSIQIGEVRWVTNGQASYLLHSGQPGGKVELALRVGQGEVERWLSPCRSGEQLTINGHQAFYRLRPQAHIWFHRKLGDVLDLVLFCPVSRRTLAMEFSGPEHEEQRQVLLEALREIVCH